MLKIKVKAGSITNLTDARYFAAREVTWLGFPLGSGEGYIDPVAVKAIIEWVDGVSPVGEFTFSTPDEIRKVCEFVGLATIQVGMFATVEELNQLRDLAVIKEVVIDRQTTGNELKAHLEAFEPVCNQFLLSFAQSGISWKDLQEGKPFTTEFLRELMQQHDSLLHIDCRPDELDSLVDSLHPYGLSFSGGEEEKTGYKSFDEMDELLDALELPESA